MQDDDKGDVTNLLQFVLRVSKQTLEIAGHSYVLMMALWRENCYYYTLHYQGDRESSEHDISNYLGWRPSGIPLTQGL